MTSIVIPSFNKAQYISETLSSLLHQTYTHWEAIIVDDGSTDGSIEIIEAYCKKDPRFTLLKREREPKGGSTCRNIGLELAKGEHLIFLDADDVLTKTCLSSRKSALKLHSEAHFLVFPGGTFYKSIEDSPSMWLPSKDNHLQHFLAHSLPWNISLPIWKTSFLRELGGFDEDYPRLQDVELHTRALMAKKVKYKIIESEPDFYYRIDEKRKLSSPYHFVDNFIKAVEIYTTKMTRYIEVRSDKKKLLKALNGTYQAAYLTAQTQYDVNNLSKEERNKLFHTIYQFHQPKNLFKLYVAGLKLGIHKIKGYNRVFKKLLSSV